MSDYEDALNGDKNAQEPLSLVDLLSVNKIAYSLPFSWEQLTPPRQPTETWVDVDSVEPNISRRLVSSDG